MNFEHHRQPLLPLDAFLRRQIVAAAISLSVLIVWIVLGILGYHFVAHLPWVDSFLNTAMIVGGMGPVDVLNSTSAKVFAGFYAICSGVILLTLFGVLAAPLFHRFLHKFHLEVEENSAKKSSSRK
ncbi:MAG: hypothetical protein WBP29_07640 [Candidatus Zixiibacteriota bacterium]